MTWTAPDVERPLPPRPAKERESLDGFLELHRATLLHKCAGLDGEQLTRRPVPSSRLSLLGLVRHLTEVERIWFRFRFAGEPLGPLYEGVPDADFELVDAARAEQDLATYLEQVEIVRRTVRDRPLDETFVFGKERKTCDLRWVYVHMIEEYARHNGHADLIRELIDGTTGS
ncbi:DinB family protein [Paractinoplanes maris]|uniref:DinB family protein n=1 Tax=Paractinoplanes maris TaxID=1734446 RepID=UPI002020640E|nr:DinB family protein [Actinoplanes maris]